MVAVVFVPLKYTCERGRLARPLEMFEGTQCSMFSYCKNLQEKRCQIYNPLSLNMGGAEALELHVRIHVQGTGSFSTNFEILFVAVVKNFVLPAWIECLFIVNIVHWETIKHDLTLR